MEHLIVDEEIDNDRAGRYVGQCKWFNDRLGYGFITIQCGPDKGKDIFVHHTGIEPLNSNYKTLMKGEYVNFDVTEGVNGSQAVHVTGIEGGTLMCDVMPIVHRPTMTTPGFVGQRFLPVNRQHHRGVVGAF